MRTTTLTFYPTTPQYKSGIAIKGTPERLYNPLTSWCGTGVFFYAFEAYFDNQHPYFSNEYAYNIGGQIAAAGHMYYYIEQLKVEGRWFTLPCKGESVPDTHSIIEINNLAAMERRAYCYGRELLCNAPYQPFIADAYLLALEQWTHLTGVAPQNETAAKFLESVTCDKLERLYTWGYLQAQEIALPNEHNAKTLSHFLQTFEELCIYHPVEALLGKFKELEIIIQPGASVQWDAYFITHGNEKVSYREFSLEGKTARERTTMLQRHTR